MSSVCNILFEALFPGSSYSTRFSALTILGSVAEVFPDPEGKHQQRRETYTLLAYCCT